MASFANDPQDIAFQTAHDSDHKVSETLGAQIACLAIAYIGVILRFLARRLARAQITSDDYATVLALVRCHVYFSAKKTLFDAEKHRADKVLGQTLYTAASIDGFICVFQ